MTNSITELDAWLAGQDLVASYDIAPEHWVAGFDPDRQVVEVKLGPFKRLFLRPPKFTKRFYHQIHPLRVETWPYRWQVKLFDDFCTVDIALDLRFQATLEYVNRNLEMLEKINEHIQELYVSVIEDKINQALTRLGDGRWVRTGLGEHEQRIAMTVCEVLTQQYIQAEATCKMNVTFADFSDVRLGRDSVYLHVLERTFELNEQTNLERLRQQRTADALALEVKQQELEHAKKLAEMQRQIQLQEAEAQIQLLLDKEQQIVQQREVETRLHVEKVDHDLKLQDLSWEREEVAHKRIEGKRRAAEVRQMDDNLAHQALLEEKQTIAEIQRRQMVKQYWTAADELNAETERAGV